MRAVDVGEAARYALTPGPSPACGGGETRVAAIFASLSSNPTASITLTSCVPAWLTQIVLPSAVVVTPQGLAAPRSTSSSKTVLTRVLVLASMMLMALVFIQPRLELRGRHLVVGENVYGIEVSPVRRNADAPHARTAVGQPDRGGLVAGRVDRRDRCRHVVRRRTIQGQMVDHEHRLAVGRDHRRNRLAENRHAGDLLARIQVDHRNVIVEAVADIKPSTVGSDRRASGRMANRNRTDQPPGTSVNDRDRALRRGARNVKLRPVGAQDLTARLGRHGNRPHHLAAGDIDNCDLTCVGIGHKQGLAVF